MAALAVALAGAGPWAKRYHAPLLAAGPQTRLSAVWARDPGAATELAGRHGAVGVASFDELLEHCDAVAFAVPPPVQAELAVQAARADKTLLIEKPIGFSLPDAERFVAELDAADAVTMLMLTNRFTVANDRFIREARGLAPRGGIAVMVAGAILPGAEFSTPWRRERGVLVDNGPHILDLLDAAFGPLVAITAKGDPLKWISLVTEHEGGAVVSVSLSLTVGIPAFEFRIQAFGLEGTTAITAHFDHDAHAEPADAIRRRLVEAHDNRRSDELDAHRGLYLQRWIDAAERSLARGATTTA